MLLTDSELVAMARVNIGARQSRDDSTAILDRFIRKKVDESIG